MADFDVIRDQTLMFFLDHLIGKSSKQQQPQTRTLHDLSCQFGAKGFTKEMRQIAGGSQAGLKKFLQKFPSLFTIDGENVMLTPLTSSNDGTKDYTKETIEFFVEKLNSYGVAEVPIKSLFGHRSQASSEIRHVSGQNVREFREFLEQHPQIFTIRNDDYVVLKSVLDKLEKDNENNADNVAIQLRRMPEEIQFDPYLMQQLIQEIETKLFKLTELYSEKVSIELLYTSMNNASNSDHLPILWNDFIKVPNDLITFLHMNSRIFLVQGHMVSLTNERLSYLRERKKQMESSNSQQQQQQQQPLQQSSQQSTRTDRPTSSTTNNGPKKPSSSSATAQQQQLATVNQRIRSQIIKIVSQSSQSSNNQHNNHVNSMITAPSSTCDNRPNESSIESLNDGNNHGQQPADQQYDNIDLALIKPKIVVKNKDCEMIIDEIFASADLPVIGFDVEGVNLGVNGDVTLIQISYRKSNGNIQIVVFDVFLNPTMIQSGLKRLLESEDVIKVGHDIRTNSVSLYNSFQITLKNVFDTQIGHLIVQQQTTGRPAYKPTKYISFYTLCTLYGQLNLNPKQKDRLHKIYRKDYKYWKNRPLTDEMIQFAITEVYALYPYVYDNLSRQIRQEYRPLFQQLVYESIFAYINIDEIKQLKRQRKFELELTDLKLKLFNNDKKKIVLSNREIRLLRYIDLTDEIRNKIEGPMNVAKKLKRFESRNKSSSNSAATANNSANDSSIINDNNDSNNNGNNSDNDSYDPDDYDNFNPNFSTGDHIGNLDSYNVDTIDNYIVDSDYYELIIDANHPNALNSTKPNPPTANSSLTLSLSSREYENSGEFNTGSNQCCHCNCHRKSSSSINNVKMTNGQPQSPMSSIDHQINNHESNSLKQYCDIGTQTLSTGDIVITKIYQPQQQQSQQSSISNNALPSNPSSNNSNSLNDSKTTMTNGQV